MHTNSKNKSILWVSFTTMDESLHKTALLNILDQFSELGYNVSLIAMRSKRTIKVENSRLLLITIPLRYIPLFSIAMFTVVLFFCLPVYILRLKPKNIIIDPNIHILGTFPGLLVSKVKKAKLVLDIRTIPVETLGFQGFMRKFWFSISILISKKLFDGVTIITPMMKKEICQNYGLNPNRVGVWTSGVSMDLFDLQNVAFVSTELKTKLGLTGKFVVLYHGIITATRGLRETIRAIEILKHKNPAIVLLLLGAGSEVPLLKDLVLQKHLQNNVIIHNPVEQSFVPSFIGVCDVGIIPLPYNSYWRYQSPLKLLEYLSMQKVVLLSDIPAHRFVVGNQRCAIYISSIGPEEIARSIEYAFNNRDKLKAWGKIGRKIIMRRYIWEKVARDLENYLTTINVVDSLSAVSH